MTNPQADHQARNGMTLSELAAWAWRETPPIHSTRGNLLIHIIAVPMFVLGHVLLVAALVVNARLAVAGAACIFCSLVMQRVGHAMEEQPVHPFAGPKDFVRRLYVEQFYNFWRFLFSGGWLSGMIGSRRQS